MKWLLVVIVMNSPIKTDLSFATLNECLLSERDMRSQWVEVYNAAVKRGVESGSLEFIKAQMPTGTCIPSKQ